MTNEWDHLEDWWRQELDSDPTYDQVVVPLILDMVGPGAGRVLDVGCGNGRIMRELTGRGFEAVGCDINASLLGEARSAGPVIRVDLPSIPLRTGSVDGVVVVLSFEHFADAVFDELARVIRPGGWMASVVNHPFVTARGAASVIDPTDGEVFWRPGSYLEAGANPEDVGDRTVTFQHRPMGEFLTVAADAGFALAELREVPFAPGGLPDAGLPRLMGVRWTRR